MKILIMGLPGSGKTTLAKNLWKGIPDSIWYNADEVRKKYDDWDFSITGRERQAIRMSSLCDPNKIVICDFVAPTDRLRTIFKADYLIWMDTILEGRFADTNMLFESPIKYSLRIENFKYSIKDIINSIMDYTKE